VSSLANTLSGIGYVILQVVIVIGVIYALARISLGHRDGYTHLIGLGVVLLLLQFWESGQLVAAIHELVTYSPPATHGLTTR